VEIELGIFKPFKYIGRKLKKAPWRKIARVSVEAATGIDIPDKKPKSPGRIERILIAIRSAIDIPIQWLKAKREV